MLKQAALANEPTAIQEPALFLEQEMQEPGLFTMAGCRIALFSAPCPEPGRLNEDAALLIPYGESGGVLAVADGVGGSRGGHEASRCALEAIRDSLLEIASAGGELREGLLNGFEQANRRVLGLGTGAATTLVAVELLDGRVRSYHVGDSEAVVVGQRGKVKLQTISHTPPGYGVEAGLLDEKEAMRHEERHLVLNHIGSADMRIDLGSRVTLSARDSLILGSDGLFDNWMPEQLLERIRQGSLETAASDLARATRSRMSRAAGIPRAKPDDLTFILLRR